MADFGLAAQIGRGGGNAMPGAQPQDQTNRMMQMLQLQQLQQNMMLAREQEARQQQLFPLQQEQLRTGTAENVARIGLVGQNTVRAREEAESATRTGTAEKGVLDYIRDTPPEERTKPERLDVLRRQNPGAYTALTNQINAARVVQEKARAENFSAERQRFEMQRVALLGMSSLLPAVRDQASYETLYSDFKTVDPTGAKLIGPRYTPESVAALRTRLQDLSDIDVKRDEQGNDILINKRDGTIRLLSAAQRPAAAPESTFSNLSGAFAANPSSPQLVGAGAASIPSPNVMATPGATPIIQPRAPAPGFGPAATAAGEKATATERAKADVERAEKERDKTIGKESFDKTFRRFVDQYKEMGRQGTLITEDSTIGQRIKTFAAAQAPGVAGVIDPKMAAPIQTLQNLRQAMVASLIAANPGMSSKSIDSNAELKSYLDSLTTPGQSVNTIVDTMNALSEKYGSGKQVTVEDIVGKSAERAPAGRGRAAPAAARGAPSVEDLLKKYQ